MAIKVAKTKAKLNLTNKQFGSLISNKVSDAVAKKFKGAESQVASRVKLVAIVVLENTKFIQALHGAFAGSNDGTDLPAEFGLAPSDAANAADDIINTIISKDSVKTSLVGRRSSTSENVITTVDVKVFDKNQYLPKLLALESGSYQSEGGDIPWLAWVLSGSNITIDDFGIVYELFDSEKKSSRSGRALMYPEDVAFLRRDNTTPWVLPSSLQTGRGDDIFEEILAGPAFKAIIQEIVIEALKKALK